MHVFNHYRNRILQFLLILLVLFGLYKAGSVFVLESDTASVDTLIPSQNTDNGEPEISDEELALLEQEKLEELLQELTEGTVSLTKETIQSFVNPSFCRYSTSDDSVHFAYDMPEIPKSDDAYIYLFGFECFEESDINLILEDTESFSKEPIAFDLKNTNGEITFPFEERCLFYQYVPTIKISNRYYPLCDGLYLSNPEELAENQTSFPESDTKKGILLDPELLHTEKLEDLGIKYPIYNIPLSAIAGETTLEAYPTIEYDYCGTTYYFNGFGIAAYDSLFSYLSSMDMITTAIILNDWDERNANLLHPLARNQAKGTYYYAMNTMTEEGVHHLEAIANYLAERYSSGEHGIVSSWIIANEINQVGSWNYMDTTDIDYYAVEFEKSLRIFYQAMKRHNAHAQVYYSIDHDWNSNTFNKPTYFNGKDLVDAINTAAKRHGNYDWGLAVHPYPNPLTRVNYWTKSYDFEEDAAIVSIMNLTVITDYMCKEEFLDTNGNVRSITVTELGFTSKSGEKLQAAAFAYCYYILDANPYIDAFILNRQTDAQEEVKQGLSFGLYNADKSEKYVKDVFQKIDVSDEYLEFTLKTIGASSLEEALSWAGLGVE